MFYAICLFFSLVLIKCLKKENAKQFYLQNYLCSDAWRSCKVLDYSVYFCKLFIGHISEKIKRNKKTTATLKSIKQNCIFYVDISFAIVIELWFIDR